MVHVNRLAKILENRQSILKNAGWMKLVGTKAQYKMRLNASKFIFRLLDAKVNKFNHLFFEKAIRSIQSRHSKSTIDLTIKKETPKIEDQIVEDPLSQEFLGICKGMTKYNIRTYSDQILSKLDPALQSEIKRFQKARGRSTFLTNN